MSSANRVVNPKGGALKRFDTNTPQIGVIKEVVDSENMGRYKVWIKGSNTLETDPSGWITCSYASPFAGASDIESLGNNIQNPVETQTSYGFWATPPDLNNEVIVVFINGDMRQAYWVACIWQKDMNNMVPGIPASNSYQSSQFGNTAIPTSEYNKTGNVNTIRPYYQTLTEGLQTQGLLTDPLRGAATSGARRDSPSQVVGILTPGGNQFVMDDGDGSQLIRLRTPSGAQILISETDGHVYAISRDGASWMELNVDGNIDFYAGSGFNVHAVGNINFNAGGNINFNSGGDVNVNSSGNLNIQAAKTLNLVSMQSASLHVGGQYTQTFIGDIQKWQTSGRRTISDNFPHPGITNNTQPKTESPSTSQQSIQNSAGQEVPTTTVCDRVPDHEPWPLHAAAAIDTPPPVEGTYATSVGNTIPDAVKPLPVMGSPTKGMKQGVYIPQGYDKNQNPVYSYSGQTNQLSPVSQLVTSAAGLQFIADQEGFSPIVYSDVGKRAIGFGHDIIASDPAYVQSGPLSKEQALVILGQDVKKAENAIKKNIKVPLTQYQFDALVDFVYNAGPGSISGTKVAKALNAGDFSQVPNLLMQWVHAHVKGKLVVLPVLVKRRRLEALTFSTPVPTS
jgi:lysozyme